MAAENGTRKLAVICSKGNLDMAYPGLVLANAALSYGIDVTLFFTFWGLDLITKTRQDHLELAPVGITSMKLSDFGMPNAGIPNIVGMLPGMTAVATKLMKDKMSKLEIPPVSEFLQMIVDGGGKLYGCKMSVDMLGLKKEDFCEGVMDVITAGDFMDLTEGAQVLFI